MKITIEVGDIDQAKAEETVTSLVAHRIQEIVYESVGRRLTEQAKQEIDKAALVLIYERINAELDRVIAEGWTPTTVYGERKGVPVTLKERVSQALNEKTRDPGTGYGAPELTVIERAMRTAIAQTLDREFAEEIKAAKAQFKAALDNEMGRRLADAVKAAFIR